MSELDQKIEAHNIETTISVGQNVNENVVLQEVPSVQGQPPAKVGSIKSIQPSEAETPASINTSSCSTEPKIEHDLRWLPTPLVGLSLILIYFVSSGLYLDFWFFLLTQVYYSVCLYKLYYPLQRLAQVKDDSHLLKQGLRRPRHMWIDYIFIDSLFVCSFVFAVALKHASPLWIFAGIGWLYLEYWIIAYLTEYVRAQQFKQIDPLFLADSNIALKGRVPESIKQQSSQTVNKLLPKGKMKRYPARASIPYRLLFIILFVFFAFVVAPNLFSTATLAAGTIPLFPKLLGAVMVIILGGILGIAVRIFVTALFWVTGKRVLISSSLELSVILQYGFIAYLNTRFRSTSNAKPNIGQHGATDHAHGDIVIRYRPLAFIDRWLHQTFHEQFLNGGVKKFLTWVVIPVMFPIALFTAFFIFFALLNPFGATTTVAGTLAGASDFSRLIINVFLSAVGGLLAIVGMYLVRQPTHIGLMPRGLRLLWRRKLYKRDGKCILWEDLAYVSIVRPANKTSPLDEKISFLRKDGKRIEIKLGSIESVQDREAMLKALQKWAPKLSRDPSIVEALQPPADHSYTELWLQALSAPPKRERLQPLITGAILHEGRYKVISLLGAGGQGQAYLAQDTHNDSKVVLKEFILPVYVDVNVRRSALEQFENEARILRQLDHPQIVKLIDFFVEDHRAYLVLEHINGASLRDIVTKDGKLPESKVKQLATQMCEILSYLHNLSPPVVHRDFTPDNLVLNVDGTLKLIDFNVAKQSVESTTSGTVVGKYAYLPPEQFRGMPTTQSDIYAMGATLHYLLTGKDPEPIAESHPMLVSPDISPQLDKIIAQSTALDLKARYQSINELKSDLSHST